MPQVRPSGIEHDKKHGRQKQGRAQVRLKQHKYKRRGEDQKWPDQILQAVHHISFSAYIRRQGQDKRHLYKFRRLDGEVSYREPSLGAQPGASDKHQQDKRQYIYAVYHPGGVYQSLIIDIYDDEQDRKSTRLNS